MQRVHGVVVCPVCETAHTLPDLHAKEVARCTRCGTAMARHVGRPQALLPLTLACLVLFALANVFPIVAIELHGQRSQTTLLGAVWLLGSGGMSVIAALVLLTTILFPFCELLLLLELLWPGSRLAAEGRHVWRIRLIQGLRPWGMIEVFMLGVLVALIKLISLAEVLPGVALWAFVALTVLLTRVLSFDPRSLWSFFEPLPRHAEPGAAGLSPVSAHLHLVPARQHGDVATLALRSCRGCGAVWQHVHEGQACARCGTAFRQRRLQRLHTSWACWWAAMILYLPANLLPMMITRSLLGQQSDTIMSGVVYFWVHGAYGLAAIVFVASFLVPLFKLAALFVLLRAAARPVPRRARELTRLYHLVEWVGRWSMLDVFVVAILAGLVHLEGMADVSAGMGIAAFGAVVVLTMLSSLHFDPRRLWDQPTEPELST